MDDREIIELYWSRKEHAISATADKYGKLCYTIANNILCNREDSEECVNDTYLRTWEAIPPTRPANLTAFLAKITRNLSLDKLKRRAAKMRGSGQITLALDEMREAVPASDECEYIVDNIVLTETLNRFIGNLDRDKRNIFLRRYWYFSSIKEIAADFGISQSKVKMDLQRLRKNLKQCLEQEGIAL